MAPQLARSIRVASAEDADRMQAIYEPYVLHTAISFEEEPPSVAEMAGRITGALPTHPYLVCEEGGEVIGYAYAGAHAGRTAYRWSVNVSVYVNERAHRCGIGQSLYRPLLRILSRQGFHSVFAGVTLPNDKSIGLHEALGFQPLGVYHEVGFKHGQWHDVGWWRLGLRDGLPSAEPTPFAVCRDEAKSLIEATLVDFDPKPPLVA